MQKKTLSLLFDLDGTLTDSAEGILNSVRIVLDHYRIEVPEGDSLHTFIGPPLRSTFPAYGVPQEEVEQAVALYRERYFTVGKYENKVYPGIEALLKKLKASGYPLYIATSKPEGLAKDILTHFGLAKYFDLICGAEIKGGRDSKASVIAHLLRSVEHIGTPIMIGDTAHDVLGAKEHGIATVGVAWGYGGTEAMREAGAVKIAETPEELFSIIEAM